jgi:hypothetical protein
MRVVVLKVCSISSSLFVGRGVGAVDLLGASNSATRTAASLGPGDGVRIQKTRQQFVLTEVILGFF